MVIKHPDEHARIEAAIASAKAVTAAEIHLIDNPASSHYGAFALIHAMIAALIAGALPVLVFPALPGPFAITIEFAVALAALACLQNRWLRQQLVPNAALHKAAWRQARLAYAHIKLKSNGEAPLVLLYCSRLERYVEILTEERVLAHVPADIWQRIVAEFRPHMQKGDEAAAFVHLIEQSATALKTNFPA